MIADKPPTDKLGVVKYTKDLVAVRWQSIQSKVAARDARTPRQRLTILTKRRRLHQWK